MKLLIFLVFCFTIPFHTDAQIAMSDLVIKKKNTNHLVHFSNKEASFWVGETHGYSEHFMMGYQSYREQILFDWKWEIDGELLKRTPSTHTAEYLPHIFTRRFDSITEEIFVPDFLDGMSIALHTNSGSSFTWTGKISNMDTLITDNANKGLLVIILKNELNKILVVSTNAQIDNAKITDDYLHISVTPKKEVWQGKKSSIFLNIGVGSRITEVAQTAGLLLTNLEPLKLRKKQRLQALLDKSYVKFPDQPDLEKSLAWATISFDALNMKEKRTSLGSGIYAGYPWFQDFWGRDSFIAMRALTITGQFETVKEHMSSFLRFQVLSDSTSEYGKVPNRARPNELIYNTADATPRLLIELDRYYRYSGDKEFIRQTSKNIEAAIIGSLKYRSDSLGFFVHDAADTWMDAKGPKGAYSPRDNRAIDIQSLWMDALEASLRMAEEFNDSEKKSIVKIASPALKKLKNNFSTYFINPDSSKIDAVLFDALSEDGTSSSKIRPNALFALGYVDFETAAKALHQISANLGTGYGVLSLASSDSMFHPFHKYEPVYEQDASYHNGIVWVWNTGEWISRLIQFGDQSLSSKVLFNYSDIILNDVTLGTLPELTDAIPREDMSFSFPDSTNFAQISRVDQMSLTQRKASGEIKPALSGTFSQAWSLSEYIRIFHEDLLGFSPLAPQNIEFAPNFIEKINTLEAKIRWKQWAINVTQSTKGNIEVFSYSIQPSRQSESFTFNFVSKSLKKQFKLTVSPELTTIRIELNLETETINVLRNGVQTEVRPTPFGNYTSTQTFELWDQMFDHSRTVYTTQLD